MLTGLCKRIADIGVLVAAGLGVVVLPAAADPVGTRIQVSTTALPKPFATKSMTVVPAWAPSDSAGFELPAGFSINVFAPKDRLKNPRWLVVAPNGDVFLSEPEAGQITLLRDADHDGRAEVISTFATGFHLPHGLAFYRDHLADYLYVATPERVWRLVLHPGDVVARRGAERMTRDGSLETDYGLHWSRSIAVDRSGHLLASIGSMTNIGEDPPRYATVQAFTPDGTRQRTFAWGLRNAVGMAFYPGTDDLYVTVNERDGLGDDLVPDYLTRVEEDGFYGWPYFYIGDHPQPGLTAPDATPKPIVPDVLFKAHSAPLGLVFYDGTQFPPDYRGDAFVALHGSWNSSKPVGYMIVRVPFKNGRPAGYYEPFLTGFLQGETSAIGRPVGLAVAADGSLLIADDLAGVIWRVSYRQVAAGEQDTTDARIGGAIPAAVGEH